MAEKRMFSSKIVCSDAFNSMSKNARLLYFELSMNADDEGVINNAKNIAILCGISVKCLDELVNNKFLIKLDNIFVIKHWFINNFLRKDRIKVSNYKKELEKLTIKDNGSYTYKVYES